MPDDPHSTVVITDTGCFIILEKFNAAVNEGIFQLERGEFLTNEEANLQVDQWLKNKMVNQSSS